MENRSDNGPVFGGKAQFATTQWSIVVAAGDSSSQVAREAMGTLCERYWYPIYVFVRRRGYSPERAEDLTQAFFAKLIEKATMASVSPEGGRFRSFLLRAVTNFLNNEHKFETAAKRGGDAEVLSIDFDDGEKRYSMEPADSVTPDLLFERNWALETLAKARAATRDLYQDQLDWFRTVEPLLTGESLEETYAQIAERLGISEAAVKTGVHRMRKQFAQCLRETIAATVNSGDQVDAEIAYLMGALRK